MAMSSTRVLLDTNIVSIQPNDAWIAACAVRHAVPLVTHNAKDFEGITSSDIITETVE